MKILLDLELTLIEDWCNPIILLDKIKFIKDSIASLETKFSDFDHEVIIFSFAVIDQRDLEVFNRTLKLALEESLNMTINSVFICSKDNLFQLASEAWSIKVLDTDTIGDIFLGNQKQSTFELFAKKNFKNKISVLFDDTVNNSIVEIFDDNLFSSFSTKLITIKV